MNDPSAAVLRKIFLIDINTNKFLKPTIDNDIEEHNDDDTEHNDDNSDDRDPEYTEMYNLVFNN